MKLPVIKIQRFSAFDGDGVRTVVFLKGCPLRCKWCHNPEGLSFSNELMLDEGRCIGCGACASVCGFGVHDLRSGHILNRKSCTLCGKCAAVCPSAAISFASRDTDIASIVEICKRDEAFYKPRGGVTLSGGEPLSHGEKTVMLLKALKEAGLSTAVETSGYFPPELINPLVEYTDEFLFDVKICDPALHERLTGKDNSLILSNLFALDRIGARIVIRRIVLPGVNDTESEMKALSDIEARLTHRVRTDRLPYHEMGKDKYTALGLEYPMQDGII